LRLCIKKALSLNALKGPTDECFSLISKALSLQPNSSELLDGRATLLNSQKKYWNALTDLKTAINLDEKNMIAYWTKATAHRGLEQHQQAILEFDKVLEFLGDEPDVNILRGESLHILEAPDAFDWIDRIPKIDEYHPRKNIFLAIYEYRRREFSQALELLDGLKIAFRRDGTDILCLRADCHLGLKNYDEAIANYQKVIEIRYDPISYVGIIHAYKMKGNEEEVKKWKEKEKVAKIPITKDGKLVYSATPDIAEVDYLRVVDYLVKS